ncbi:sigma-70, region 3 protein [Toxoplasma gondii TgCatPRC2]|uniref:Sigma-70, region 3 protein n=2 Tax=Toxoplasma gondii TaxID=5811 RepID=A0A151H4C0_TOXGO|nr:sigma-70, region 3 protein [Toxoplasma gondii ARI]KYK64103.1 sigma-70, region 3 protein [Toxoplasma gondii TgCatPRC2]
MSLSSLSGWIEGRVDVSLGSPGCRCVPRSLVKSFVPTLAFFVLYFFLASEATHAVPLPQHGLSSGSSSLSSSLRASSLPPVTETQSPSRFPSFSRLGRPPLSSTLPTCRALALLSFLQIRSSCASPLRLSPSQPPSLRSPGCAVSETCTGEDEGNNSSVPPRALPKLHSLEGQSDAWYIAFSPSELSPLFSSLSVRGKRGKRRTNRAPFTFVTACGSRAVSEEPDGPFAYAQMRRRVPKEKHRVGRSLCRPAGCRERDNWWSCTGHGHELHAFAPSFLPGNRELLDRGEVSSLTTGEQEWDVSQVPTDAASALRDWSRTPLRATALHTLARWRPGDLPSQPHSRVSVRQPRASSLSALLPGRRLLLLPLHSLECEAKGGREAQERDAWVLAATRRGTQQHAREPGDATSRAENGDRLPASGAHLSVSSKSQEEALAELETYERIRDSRLLMSWDAWARGVGRSPEYLKNLVTRAYAPHASTSPDEARVTGSTPEKQDPQSGSSDPRTEKTPGRGVYPRRTEVQGEASVPQASEETSQMPAGKSTSSGRRKRRKTEPATSADLRVDLEAKHERDKPSEEERTSERLAEARAGEDMPWRRPETLASSSVRPRKVDEGHLAEEEGSEKEQGGRGDVDEASRKGFSSGAAASLGALAGGKRQDSRSEVPCDRNKPSVPRSRSRETDAKDETSPTREERPTRRSDAEGSTRRPASTERDETEEENWEETAQTAWSLGKLVSRREYARLLSLLRVEAIHATLEGSENEEKVPFLSKTLPRRPPTVQEWADAATGGDVKLLEEKLRDSRALLDVCLRRLHPLATVAVRRFRSANIFAAQQRKLYQEQGDYDAIRALLEKRNEEEMELLLVALQGIRQGLRRHARTAMRRRVRLLKEASYVNREAGDEDAEDGEGEEEGEEERDAAEEGDLDEGRDEEDDEKEEEGGDWSLVKKMKKKAVKKNEEGPNREALCDKTDSGSGKDGENAVSVAPFPELPPPPSVAYWLWMRTAMVDWEQQKRQVTQFPWRWWKEAARGRKASHGLYAELGREPTEAEVADRLGISLDKWRDISVATKAATSLETELGGPHGSHDPNDRQDTVGDLLVSEESLESESQMFETELETQVLDLAAECLEPDEFQMIKALISEPHARSEATANSAAWNEDNTTRAQTLQFMVGDCVDEKLKKAIQKMKEAEVKRNLESLSPEERREGLASPDALEKVVQRKSTVLQLCLAASTKQGFE